MCHPGWGTAGWAVRRGAGSAQIPAAAAGSGAGGGGPLSEGKVTLGDAGEEGGGGGGRPAPLKPSCYPNTSKQWGRCGGAGRGRGRARPVGAERRGPERGAVRAAGWAGGGGGRAGTALHATHR